MKSICLFSSYFQNFSLPGYIKVYLSELSLHFTEIVFLTNPKELTQADLSFLNSINTKTVLLKNKGHDFGMWYRALKEMDTTQYDRVALVNDSNVLFRKLDPFFNWLDKSKINFAGMLDSYERQYHLQSYFLVLQNNAIPLAVNYFKRNGIINNKRKIIRVYELGLTKYLQENGVNVDSFYKVKKYDPNFTGNPSYFLLERLLNDGFPMMKKHIVFNSFAETEQKSLEQSGFNFDRDHYFKLIDKSIDWEKLVT